MNPDWYTAMVPGKWYTFSGLPDASFADLIALTKSGQLEERYDEHEQIYYFRRPEGKDA